MQVELGLKPNYPAYLRLDRPFPLRTPSGGSPALTPYRSMPPAVETAQKRDCLQGARYRSFFYTRLFRLWPLVIKHRPKSCGKLTSPPASAYPNRI
jgi:hypothetical protein